MKTSSLIKLAMAAVALLLLPALLASCCCCLTTTGVTAGIISSVISSSSSPDTPNDGNNFGEGDFIINFGPGYNGNGGTEYYPDIQIQYGTMCNFVDNYSNKYNYQYVIVGEPLPEPYRSGFTFGGWYADAELTILVETATTEYTTLYAHWLEETKACDFEYSMTDDGYIVINKYIGIEEWVRIPEYIGGTRVTGIGDYAFAESQLLREIRIPDGLVTIGEFAFYNCEILTDVCFGMDVTTIGMYAFADCDALRSIDIGVSVNYVGDHAFSNCTALENVYFGNSELQYIGEYAFSDCSSLYEITLPSALTDISNGVFYGCSALTSVVFGDNIHTIGEYAFAECKSLTSFVAPYSLASIGEYAFIGCTGLYSVELGDNIKNIYDGVFERCTSLTSLVLPQQLLTIGKCAFMDCSSLMILTLPDSLQYIGEQAFEDCTNLTVVTIPNSVESVGYCAFAGCNSIEEISLPFVGNNRETGYFGYIFGADSYNSTAYYVPESLRSITLTDGNTVHDYAFYGCYNVEEFNFTNDVVAIGDYAFYGCSALTSFSFSEAFRSMGSYAFWGCSLTELEFPVDYDALNSYGYSVEFTDTSLSGCGDITSATVPVSAILSLPKNQLVSLTVTMYGEIPVAAFQNCHTLEYVCIGTGVSKIGAYAFENCSKLSRVETEGATAYGMGVTEIDSYAFSNCRSLERFNLGSSATIGEWAFANCSKLESFSIPDSDYYNVSIGNYAFYSCSSLAYIYLGSNLESIGYMAFNGCTAVQQILYSGSQDDWDNIDIDMGNTAISIEKIICNYW